MPYSKKQALTKFQSGWARWNGLPGLVLVDAHDAVAEVVVLADHVGVGVVQLVVRSASTARPGRRCPTPRSWSGSSGRASSPTGRAGRCGRSPCSRGSWRRARPAVPTIQAGGNSENSSTAREPSSSLRWVSITLRMYAASSAPRRVEDLLADRVELDADLLDVLGGSGGRSGLVGASSGSTVMSSGVVLSSVVDVAGAGGGARCRSGWRPPSPGAAVVISPLRRSRTAPSRSGSTQPKQMPIRHPLGIRTPASSAASRIGVAPSASTAVPLPVKVTVPPSPAATRGGAELLGEQRQAGGSSWCASSASSSPAGPQAKVVRSARSGTRSARSVDVEDAVLVVVPRDEADRAGLVERRAGRR